MNWDGEDWGGGKTRYLVLNRLSFLLFSQLSGDV